jgi:hypothetical protein
MIAHLRSHPGVTGIIGTVTGWVSVDLLRTAQFLAAFLAGLVSFLTLFIIAPKAIEGMRSVYASAVKAGAWLRAWWADRPWKR